MDGIKGPEDDDAKGNDVITVCKNSHCFHRNCILASCRVSGVKALAQMGEEVEGDDEEYLQPMEMNNSCPLCKQPLLPSCESFVHKIKLPLPLIVSGGRRGRKSRKIRKGKKMYTKKRKQSKRKQSKRKQSKRKQSKRKQIKRKQSKRKQA
jgi:hypothetical protein